MSLLSPSVSFSDLGLDQFIVKRYDGKVRSGHVCRKEDGPLGGSEGETFNNYVLETVIYLLCSEVLFYLIRNSSRALSKTMERDI